LIQVKESDAQESAMSPSGPSRHFGAAQQMRRFWSEADINSCRSQNCAARQSFQKFLNRSGANDV
jgi:hypothetical protein